MSLRRRFLAVAHCLVVSVRLFVAADAVAQERDVRNLDAKSEEEWAYSVGIQNYVFGLPLVIFERERSLRLDPTCACESEEVCPRSTN